MLLHTPVTNTSPCLLVGFFLPVHGVRSCCFYWRRFVFGLRFCSVFFKLVALFTFTFLLNVSISALFNSCHFSCRNDQKCNKHEILNSLSSSCLDQSRTSLEQCRDRVLFSWTPTFKAKLGLSKITTLICTSLRCYNQQICHFLSSVSPLTSFSPPHFYGGHGNSPP